MQQSLGSGGASSSCSFLESARDASPSIKELLQPFGRRAKRTAGWWRCARSQVDRARFARSSKEGTRRTFLGFHRAFGFSNLGGGGVAPAFFRIHNRLGCYRSAIDLARLGCRLDLGSLLLHSRRDARNN
jgi:hypothetical protein